MKYKFEEDLKSIRTILGLSQTELANKLGVEQITISRNENGITEPSAALLENTYNFAFENNIRLNRLKEMFCLENMKPGNRLLFHGSKNVIEGQLSIHAGRKNNDFGEGFYAGESYDQAVAFVSYFNNSNVYFMDFNPTGLKVKRYDVDEEWMMTTAYYRTALNDYKNHPMITELINKSRDCDYIIAPIADNKMFQIINAFISGEITNEQCLHCLAATNLGMQYVFTSDKAINQLQVIEKSYISSKEKAHYQSLRSDDAKLGEDKVKLARIKYRGQGKYIDEILK